MPVLPRWQPFYNIAWLAREEARPSTPESPPLPNIVYFPDLKDALKSHMHAKHRFGYADCKTGCYTYYQSLLPHVNKGIRNAFWNMPCVSTCVKSTIFHTAQAPSPTKNMRYALKGPLALYALSQNVIISYDGYRPPHSLRLSMPRHP
eukprot:1145115-Pelagomonas_calceolata.AAC.1